MRLWLAPALRLLSSYSIFSVEPRVWVLGVGLWARHRRKSYQATWEGNGIKDGIEDHWTLRLNTLAKDWIFLYSLKFLCWSIYLQCGWIWKWGTLQEISKVHWAHRVMSESKGFVSAWKEMVLVFSSSKYRFQGKVPWEDGCLQDKMRALIWNHATKILFLSS